jgi:hypothetical protein
VLQALGKAVDSGSDRGSTGARERVGVVEKPTDDIGESWTRHRGEGS